MRSSLRPQLLIPGAPIAFPDPNTADDEGLIAVGGDLTPERLLVAYEHGIFPWYDAGFPQLWWSPNPRGVIERTNLHVSRSMLRELKRPRYGVSFNRCFERVMVECGSEREGGTWILSEMVEAYLELHRRGFAHSFEVWEGNDLVGGLYGVQRGALFAAESKFHRRTNASKLALITSVITLFSRGIELYDVQFVTDHLETLGATEIARSEYVSRAEQAATHPVSFDDLEDPLAETQAELGL